jgi:hypothetical protein
VGQLKNGKRPLFACESGLTEPARKSGWSEHAFVLLIWQKKHDKWVKWKNSYGAHLQKQLQTALILFVTFISSHP